MARTLDDYLQRSKRANSKEVSAARTVFDQAYGIACQVIELREKHNLTQVELAEKTGVPQAQISRIERGVVSPTSATLGKIAEPLGAFYAYPNISVGFRDGISSALQFAEKLLAEKSVAVVPGEAFGTTEHIRISYATSMKELERGLDRIDSFISGR